MACNRFADEASKQGGRIGIPEVTKSFLAMATDYFWPLMEEVAPKLGVYEPLVEPARQTIEAIVEHICRPVKEGSRGIAQDRVLIHRQIVGSYTKVFEILEYLGFVARREASRALKSGGRGPVFALNLCSILESIPSKRLTIEMIDEWLSGVSEPAEMHVSGSNFQKIKLPPLPEGKGLGILEKSVKVLGKSPAYPYGLTEDMINRLERADITNVQQLANTNDASLDAIDYIGPRKIKRIRDVVYQAIWM